MAVQNDSTALVFQRLAERRVPVHRLVDVVAAVAKVIAVERGGWKISHLCRGRQDRKQWEAAEHIGALCLCLLKGGGIWNEEGGGAREWEGGHTALVGDSPWVKILSVKWKVPVSTSSPEGMQRRQSPGNSEKFVSKQSFAFAVHFLGFVQ